MTSARAGRLVDKIAIITGGAGGLGAAIASRFAREGASIVVADMASKPSEGKAPIDGVLSIPVDVTKEDSVADLFRHIDRNFGRLDILVNSAGVGGSITSIAEADVADWDAVFAVNLRGTLACMKYAIPLLKRQGGAIVNIVSRAGLRGIPFQVAYSASKFSVIGLTMAAAQEVGSFGVRVNAICPGAVDTALYRANAAARAARSGGNVEDDKTRLAGLAALKRLADPEDVAAAAVYLASDESDAVTGEALRIDGGRL